ncbi:MAG TPA: hypothetical protein VHC22_07550 [Pirellulales bacterium]|nr:hypothetical protein [Pirellulales bacterium]
MRKPNIHKKLISSHHDYQLYSVDATALRTSAEGNEEFGNFATHDEFPHLIGPKEIWVADKLLEREGLFYQVNALARLGREGRGQTKDSAYEAGLKLEQLLREELTGIKYRDGEPHRRVPEAIYVERYVEIPDEVQRIHVWRIDGHLARCYYKTDYTEGGHGYVYPWVPKNQIWIEKDIHLSELPFITAHEYTELRLMRDRGFGYDKAHEICSKVEFDLRWRQPIEDFVAGSRRHKLGKADVVKLTSPEFFQYVLKKYVR